MQWRQPKRIAAKVVAVAFVAGERNEDRCCERIARVITASAREIRAVVRRLLAGFGASARPRAFQVARFLEADTGFQRLYAKENFAVNRSVQWVPAMRPAEGPPATWCVLSLLTVGELAARLNLTPKDLAWFADRRNLAAKNQAAQLRHYRYRWIEKRIGAARLIESPKPRLKAIQRYLLREILERIPAHEAAHGFRKNRSIMSFTGPHVGRAVVIRLDLQNFFTSLTRARVLAIFLTAGYPESVAEILANLCTHSTPADIMRGCPVKLDVESADKFRQWHLPQGAPTSPALANLCAFHLDCRLTGLARAVNVNYTRYADDLVFSGDFTGVRAAERFNVAVCRIALEEGFTINTRKTRVMRRSVSQRAAGVVLNEKQNVARKEYDHLKAVLHNCAKRGVASQTEEPVDIFLARLSGRIAHVEMINPRRGGKLRAVFDIVRRSCEKAVC